MHIFTNPNYDFLRWRWHAVALSWIVILAGVFVLLTKGLPRGIEFAGGTAVITKFDHDVSVQQVRAALEKTFGGQNVVIQSYGDPSQHQVLSRVPQSGAETRTRSARRRTRSPTRSKPRTSETSPSSARKSSAPRSAKS
jgi:preprotein translocase subunit SecF